MLCNSERDRKSGCCHDIKHAPPMHCARPVAQVNEWAFISRWLSQRISLHAWILSPNCRNDYAVDCHQLSVLSWLKSRTSNFSTVKEWPRSRKVLLTCLGVTAGGISAFIYALDSSAKAVDLIAHPPTYKWDFYGWFNSLDHASMRRGWEVYKNVCAACHSLQYVAYRHLIDVTHTEAEAKALAEEVMIEDGPNDTGEYFKRPGKLFDYVPSPYPNEEAARAANNGSYPPDLSYMLNARHDGENYVFALLTGYCDPPAGINLREGQYFNPYFPGGAIGMAQAIYNEVLEYEDGTPATASQVAKDITTFLMWTANHEFDDRKRMTIKAIGIFSILTAAAYYFKRHKWTTIKSTKLMFVPKKYR